MRGWLAVGVAGLVACGGATSQEPTSSGDGASGNLAAVTSGTTGANSGATGSAGSPARSGGTVDSGASTGAPTGSSGARSLEAGPDARPTGQDAPAAHVEPTRDAETSVDAQPREAAPARLRVPLGFSTLSYGETTGTLDILKGWSPKLTNTSGVFTHVQLNFSAVSACGFSVAYDRDGSGWANRSAGPGQGEVPLRGAWSYEVPLTDPIDPLKQRIWVDVTFTDSQDACFTEISSIDFWN